MVEQYQKYETDIFDGVEPKNSMTMVTLYPELKSVTNGTLSIKLPVFVNV